MEHLSLKHSSCGYINVDGLNYKKINEKQNRFVRNLFKFKIKKSRNYFGCWRGVLLASLGYIPWVVRV